MKQRLRVIGALCLVLLTLAACTGRKADDVRTATPDGVIAATATASLETQEPTEVQTQPPTEAPTEPATEDFVPVKLDDARSDPDDIYDATGFVSVSDLIPDVRLDIRYYSDYNFVGTRIDGYEEPLALLTKEAAKALNAAAKDLRKQGWGLVIYDAYRPARAVDHFIRWANDYSDTAMKADFYPDLDKSVLFDYGYIGYRSGHSRGSTVDLSLYDLSTGEEADMGGTFDYFSEVSHPYYDGVTSGQYENRMRLRSAMTAHGFEPLSTEWWHFSLGDEPYPYTYFDFPVSSDVLTYDR